jgi:hypothetical protein
MYDYTVYLLCGPVAHHHRRPFQNLPFPFCHPCSRATVTLSLALFALALAIIIALAGVQYHEPELV